MKTLGIQEWTIQKHWQHWAYKNGQSRDTDNIGHTRMDNPETLTTLGIQEWTIQRHWQHWAYKNGQSRDTDNIGHTRMDNPETLTTLGIQEWTIQRHWQHWAYKTKTNKYTEHRKLQRWADQPMNEGTHVLKNGKWFLRLIRHSPCYSYSPVVYDTTIRNNTNKTWVILQTTGVNTNRSQFLCENSNGRHDKELQNKDIICVKR
jgi:nitrogen fixation-related uncharacterized protein